MPRAPTYRRKIHEWASSLEARNLSTDTINSYQDALRGAWKYGMENGWPKNPKLLQPKHVKAYLDHLKRFSSSTQHCYGNALLLYLKWCQNKNFKEFKLKIKVERSNVDWLTVEEAINIVANAPNVWVRAMESMMIYTGLRVSELANLRLSDVHDDHIMVFGKGRKARKIPINGELLEMIGPYLAWRRTIEGHIQFLLRPHYGGRPVRPYSADGIQTAIRLHSKHYGRHFSPHTFRRSFGRHLYRAGMQLIEIQRLYGHSSSDVTTKYLGITEEDLSASLIKFQPSYKRAQTSSPSSSS